MYPQQVELRRLLPHLLQPEELPELLHIATNSRQPAAAEALLEYLQHKPQRLQQVMTPQLLQQLVTTAAERGHVDLQRMLLELPAAADIPESTLQDMLQRAIIADSGSWGNRVQPSCESGALFCA